MRQQPFASPTEALEHHGVKGMKWGVRKREETSSRPAGRVGVQSQFSRRGGKPETPTLKVSELSERGQRRVAKFRGKAEVAKTRAAELRLENKTYLGSKNLIKNYKHHTNKQTIKELEKEQKRALKDAQAVQKKKLTSAQKKAIVGGVAVAALIGAGAVYQLKTGKLTELDQSGRLNSLQLRTQARLRGQKVPFRVNKDLARKMSADEILKEVGKPVNPLYKSMGGQMNCRRCTYTHELRRRGYDVRATTSAVGWGQSESGVINALTTEGKDFFSPMSMSQAVVSTGGSSKAAGDARKIPGAKIILDNLTTAGTSEDKASVARIMENLMSGRSIWEGIDKQAATTVSDSKKVLEELARQPNGSRGEVVFKFPSFGHSMHYEVIDGVPKIFDSQKGQMYDLSKRVESKWDGFTGAEIRRLDNMELDLDFLSRWATNAK